MKIAIVITAKNEARVLRNNILYHKAIGISKAFVYFDNTTDQGKESISDIDIVEVSESIVNEYKDQDNLQKFNDKSKDHHTARQCLNTYDAIQKCKTSGIDWLISLDADELICTNLDDPTNLGFFFNEIKDSIDLVTFLPYELLQSQLHFENVFAEAHYFKATHKFNRKIDRIYKAFYNPFTKTNIKFSYWYGQHLGKVAVRVNSNQEIIPKNVHRYTYSDGEPIESISVKGMLHYHMYDANDFVKKFKNFKNRPDHFLSGNKVESLKLLCRDIVNSDIYSEAELHDYYSSNVMFSAKELKELITNKNRLFINRREPSVIKITSVKKVFSKINAKV